MRTIGILLSRIDSSRLPRKALLDVGGIPLIQCVALRARNIINLGALVLATTSRPIDDVLVQWAESLRIEVFRGEVDDVVGRVISCMRKFDATHALRLNGDSPFLDFNAVSHALNILDGQETDLVTNLIPRMYPYGMAIEIFSLGALERASATMQMGEREHVTSYFYRSHHDFNIMSLPPPPLDMSSIRLVVDDERDLVMARAIVAELHGRFATATSTEIIQAYQCIKNRSH